MTELDDNLRFLEQPHSPVVPSDSPTEIDGALSRSGDNERAPGAVEQTVSLQERLGESGLARTVGVTLPTIGSATKRPSTRSQREGSHQEGKDRYNKCLPPDTIYLRHRMPGAPYRGNRD